MSSKQAAEIEKVLSSERILDLIFENFIMFYVAVYIGSYIILFQTVWADSPIQKLYYLNLGLCC